jgi:hypothetical protein
MVGFSPFSVRGREPGAVVTFSHWHGLNRGMLQISIKKKNHSKKTH